MDIKSSASASASAWPPGLALRMSAGRLRRIGLGWGLAALATSAISATTAATTATPAAVPAVKPAAAQTSSGGPQALVPSQSEVAFTARQLGVPLNGRFTRFTAQTAFDPKAPQTSKIAFQVDLGSVSIDPDTDKELLKPEWFNAVKFPKATFQSTAIKALGAGKYQVTGKLAIKGLTRDLSLPVQLAQAGALSTATGGFVLKRLDFKIGDGEWGDTSVVADEVQVRFKLVLQGIAPM